MSTKLFEIENFVAIVNEGSFTQAATTLGVSKSHVSKYLTVLEDRLGVQLLTRTTRKLSLTSEGVALYERAQQILVDLSEAEESIVNLNTTPRGLLRISMPMTLGTQFVSPMIARFLLLYPEVRVDLDFSDRLVDMIAEGFDLVIRVGQLEDSSLIAKRLAAVKGVFVASPEYLAQRGIPRTPFELTQHECLDYSYHSSAHWKLQRRDESVHVAVSGRVRANNGIALMDAAKQGLGIVPLPDFIVNQSLVQGSLVVVLPEWTDADRGVYALYAQNRFLSAKVRACVEFLAQEFKQVPW